MWPHPENAFTCRTHRILADAGVKHIIIPDPIREALEINQCQLSGRQNGMVQLQEVVRPWNSNYGPPNQTHCDAAFKLADMGAEVELSKESYNEKIIKSLVTQHIDIQEPIFGTWHGDC